MDSHRESHHRHENVTSSSLNGDSEPTETYHKVHHDLDSAAAKRKPIVTESNYKVTTAEPAVEDRPAHMTKTNVTKTSTTHSSSNQHKGSKSSNQKGQFISKPEYENQRDNDGEDDDDDSGAGAWIPLLGGAAAIAALIGGLFYYKKKNPDVDQKFRRSVEDADHRVKGALGTGERRVKEFLGSGQQRLKNLVGRTAEHIDNDSDDDEHHGHGGFGNNGVYKVKKGDNMAKIAQKTGNKSWHEIAEKNPRFRNPNLIYPGDELRV
jgi:hypothetical protein